MGGILFGVAGWSYPDWKGVFYPEPRPRGFDELGFVASWFDAVEVNNTFYRPPSAKNAADWVSRVSGKPKFCFTIKAHKRFTHDPDSPWTAEEAAQFMRGVEPIASAGALGALLFQYPFHFANDEAGRAALSRISREFGAFPLVVELRHRSWETAPVARFIESLRLGSCHIDAPDRDGPPPAEPAVTSGVAYLRFHGRNREEWFKKGAGRDAKYDYLYTSAELAQWLEPLKNAAARASKTFVIGNNHFKGKAPANIAQLRAMVEGTPVAAPQGLFDTYPALGEQGR